MTSRQKSQKVKYVLHRKVNIFFLLALVFVFIIYGDAQDHTQILLGVFFALLFTAAAFLLNWLTIDGATSAAICGSIAYGVGGMTGAGALLVFFVSSSLLSKNFIQDHSNFSHSFRRDGSQVWSNGFWFSLWILIWLLSAQEAFMIAGITAVAVSTADTWATEIGGNRLKAKAWLLTTHKQVEAGTEGGISVPGTLASLGGAFVISVTYWLLNNDTHLFYLLTITAVGFSGSILDSYLGARFQTGKSAKFSLFGSKEIIVDNNFVNWFSSGVASIISLLLTLIISL